MSKSLGNSVEPNEICEKWGADLLRLWVASVEYQADVKMSERVMTQLSEAYRKSATHSASLSAISTTSIPQRIPFQTTSSKKWMVGCSNAPPTLH